MSILGFATGISTLTEGTGSPLSGSTTATYINGYVNESCVLNESNGMVSMAFKWKPHQGYMWLSMTRYDNNLYWTNRHILSLIDTEGVEWLRGDSIQNIDIYDFQFFNGEEMVALTRVGGAVAKNTVNRWDIAWQPTHVSIYCNGGLYATYKGSVPKPSKPLEALMVYPPDTSLYLSSCFACTEDSRGITMVQHTLTADGTHHNDFAGSYNDINDFGVTGSGTPTTASSAEQTQTYVTSDAVADFSSGYDIMAVGVYARAAVDGLGTITGLVAIGSDGTNTLESDRIEMDSIMRPRVGVLYTAPDGSAWDVTKLNAAEFGLRSKA
ncbi:TPA: hypothetical protein NGR52_004213 [Vibrio parahaemolyticus]|nr:hypothetical protein [Vibrio parahaemolyticus]